MLPPGIRAQPPARRDAALAAVRLRGALAGVPGQRGARGARGREVSQGRREQAGLLHSPSSARRSGLAFFPLETGQVLAFALETS